MGSWRSTVRSSLKKKEIKTGGECPIIGPRRKGVKPAKQLDVQEFSREIQAYQHQSKGKKQNKAQEKEIVSKQIITANV